MERIDSALEAGVHVPGMSGCQGCVRPGYVMVER